MKLAPGCIGGLRQLGDFLLDEDEPPELVGPPVCCKKGISKPHLLERIKTQVHYAWPIEMDLGAEPTVGLINEGVFEVSDPSSRQRRLGEVPELVVNAEVNFPKSAVLKFPSLGSGDEPGFYSSLLLVFAGRPRFFGGGGGEMGALALTCSGMRSACDLSR